MAELKTRPTGLSVSSYLSSIPDPVTRKDCHSLVKLMSDAAHARPKMWGPSIVGFGSNPLRYASGRELDWPPIGFSPRKRNLTIYLMGGLAPHASLLKQLGKHKRGKGCLYISRLDDIHLPTFKKLLQDTFRHAAAVQKQVR